MRSMILAACARSAAVDSNNFQSAAVGLIHTINAASPIRLDISLDRRSTHRGQLA